MNKENLKKLGTVLLLATGLLFSSCDLGSKEYCSASGCYDGLTDGGVCGTCCGYVFVIEYDDGRVECTSAGKTSQRLRREKRLRGY